MTTQISEESLAPKPWGLIGTVVFSFIAFIVMSLIQGLVLVVYALKSGFVFDLSDPALTNKIQSLALDGDLLGLAEIPSAIIGVSLIVIFASMRKPLTVRRYLDLYWPKFTTMLKWLGIMFLGMIIMQFAMNALGVETSQFMIDIYGSTENKLLLWTAVVIGAPFFEEFLFRGFLLEGLRNSFSRLINPNFGAFLAITISSGIWAIIHMQYGWIEIGSIFAIGILLGIARIKTGSLYIPIAMHMMMNLLASLAMEFQTELEQLEKSIGML